MQFRLFFIWVSNMVSTFSSSAQTVCFQLWFLAYHFAPSLFLFSQIFWLFTNCFSIELLLWHLCFAYQDIAVTDCLIGALRIYLYIGITSLCLYNTTKYFTFQDGKLDKVNKIKLCNIQIKAKNAQKKLTTLWSYDMINMLGRSIRPPHFLIDPVLNRCH